MGFTDLWLAVRQLLTSDSLSSVSEIVEHGHRDAHGCIWLGLEPGQRFRLWRHVLSKLPGLWRVFGPTVFVTDYRLAKRILALAKVDPEGYFAGNKSSSSVARHIGRDNIFHPRDRDQHQRLRQAVSTYFSRVRLESVLPAIETHFTGSSVSEGGWIDLIPTVQDFVDHVLLVLLVGRVDAELMEACRGLRRRVHSVWSMLCPRRAAALGDCCADSFMGWMQERGYTADECVQMVEMLIAVGSPNLVSALITLLWRLGQSPADQEALRAEVREDRFLSVDSGRALEFFTESLRQAPPVWLQARKVKRTLELPVQEGAEETVSFPRGTLLLIPNHALNASGDAEGWAPFSTGPNRCIGTTIARPVIGWLLGYLLCFYDLTAEGSLRAEGAVALSYRADDDRSKPRLGLRVRGT